MTAAEVTTATAIPSTLPDAGIDLTVELERYREWMIGQALALAHGNEQRAADLLGLNRTTLVEMLARSTASARVESPSMAQPAPAAEPGVDAKTAEVPTRIPWDLVASMRAEGSNDGIIARRVRSIIGGNYWAIEKALKQPRPIAKCGP